MKNLIKKIGKVVATVVAVVSVISASAMLIGGFIGLVVAIGSSVWVSEKIWNVTL